MISSQLAIAVLVAFLALISASTHTYTASLSAGDSMGYFRVGFTLSKQAAYTFEVDLTTFKTSCDLSQGLNYYLYSTWSDSDRASTSTCSQNGGHYDPYLACGPKSQGAGSNCAAMGRTSSQGYSYRCTPESYQSGHYALCEVGDLSGKFGRIMPASNDSMIFKADLVDFHAPAEANFDLADAVAQTWKSVSFLCPADNSHLVCGEFFHDMCDTKTGGC